MIPTPEDYLRVIMEALSKLPDIDNMLHTLRRLGLILDPRIDIVRRTQLNQVDVSKKGSLTMLAILSWQVRGLLGGIQMLAKCMDDVKELPTEWRDELRELTRDLTHFLNPP